MGQARKFAGRNGSMCIGPNLPKDYITSNSHTPSTFRPLGMETPRPVVRTGKLPVLPKMGRGVALGRRQGVDLALDIEQRINALHGFNRERIDQVGLLAARFLRPPLRYRPARTLCAGCGRSSWLPEQAPGVPLGSLATSFQEDKSGTTQLVQNLRKRRQNADFLQLGVCFSLSPGYWTSYVTCNGTGRPLHI
ncbi:hypothetical protein MES5069_220142 [Mesorhizobium escarrei]|uniref:Uncharacterized protein n=1 Tax=Mesorhizobium escarrei TaxID=666018 RepID=A0ABM9DRR6_9HYPH|nr:hypothetical protein MES5069_220142 [Mesorhizobium escarrei]